MTIQDIERIENERLEINLAHANRGVIFVDIRRAYIEKGVTIGEGTKIYPDVHLEGNTIIGKNAIIGANSQIKNSNIGDETEVKNSVIEDSKIGCRTSVGPFAYLRPKSNIGDDCKIGDFVEVKNSNFGNGSKASHLTYIGDSDVGEKVNLGCGVVFVNYDGTNKFRSTVEDGAFVGCNVNIVSPVNIGKNSYIAAGSTVTGDVTEDALFVARANGKVIEGWAARKRRLKKD